MYPFEMFTVCGGGKRDCDVSYPARLSDFYWSITNSVSLKACVYPHVPPVGYQQSSSANNRFSQTSAKRTTHPWFPTVRAESRLPTSNSFAEQRREELKAKLRSGTGWDRLNRMFSYDEYYQASPELRYILKGGYTSLAFGAIFGALSSFATARENFMRQNVATRFESEYLARRQLSDRMSLAAIRGALSYGLKLGAFTTVYLTITLSAANFNNRVTVFEHMAAGALFGAVMKINYGLKGVAVASGLGGFLGLFAGGVVVTLMKLSGVSFEDLRLWQHEYYAIKLDSSKYEEAEQK